MFSKATLKERRQYYREEWSVKDLPDFITKIRRQRYVRIIGCIDVWWCIDGCGGG